MPREEQDVPDIDDDGGMWIGWKHEISNAKVDEGEFHDTHIDFTAFYGKWLRDTTREDS